MNNRFIKFVVIAGAFIFSSALHAQTFSFDHGEIEFYTASMLSDIEAVSKEAKVNLNPQTGEIEVSIDINSFEFEYDLMKKHFNEKHMESDQFPNATFVGKVAQDLSNGIASEMEIDAPGKLTIHGITREVKLKGTISKENEYVVIKSKIIIVFKDYNVDEPSILSKPVAKDVEVKSKLYLK